MVDTIPENLTLADSSRNDVTNPFYLNHSDNPGLVLISKPLVGDNYASWHRSMSKSLNAKNKLGFVNDTIKVPSSIDDPDEYALWSRCNDLVHSWLVNSLASDIADIVVYYVTAREVWEDLRERFSQSNAPRIYEIQRDIAYLRQDQLSVAAYYTKLKGLWDELASYVESCQCGAQLDRQKLMQFLMGLNDSYAAVRGQVLLMNPLPSVRQAYYSIAQEERQRALTHSAPQASEMSAAMAVRNGRQNRGGDQTHRGDRSDQVHHADQSVYQLNYRGNQTHRGEQGFWRHNSGGNGRRPHCVHCDTPGHYIDTCYQLHGFPQGHPKYRDRKSRTGGVARTAANLVSESEGATAANQALNGLSDTQLQQIMSIINQKGNGEINSQANVVNTIPVSGYEEDDWFG